MRLFRVTSFNKLLIRIAFVCFLGRELASASKRCQSIVRRVVIKQCSNQVQKNETYLDETDSKIGDDGSDSQNDKQHNLNYKTGVRKRRSMRNLKKNSVNDISHDMNIRLMHREIFELYQEIYHSRHTRSTDENTEKAKKVFLEIAAKCCNDESVCMDKQITPCPT